MNTSFSFHNRHLLVLFLLSLSSTIALAQTQDLPSTIVAPSNPEGHPCNILIEGDIEPECVLPFENNLYYNEEPNTLFACQGMKVTYTAHADLGGQLPQKWEWHITGESYYTDNGNGSIIVVWGEGNSGHLSVTVYDQDSIACTKTINVKLIEKPTIAIASSPAYVEQPNGSKIIYVCKGETIEFTDISPSHNTNIVGYYWETLQDGTTSSSPNYRIENVWHEDKVIHRVYNNCGCYDEETYEIRLLEGEILNLDCYGSVCEGTMATYTASSPICNQFSWYIEGGTLINGQNTQQITVLWDNPHNGYGVIAIDGNICGNNTCPTMLSKKIPIIEDNLSINGQTTVCEEDAVIYSIPLFGSTEYTWNITPSSGIIQTTVNNANEQMYIFNQAGVYHITVSYKCDFLNCGTFTSAPLTVIVKPKLSISGNERICISNPCHLTTFPSTAANWTIYDIDNNDQIVASFSSLSSLSTHLPHPGKYLIVAHDTNFCNNAEFFLTVQNTPPAPSILDLDPDNPHTACLNSGILLKAKPSNPDYTIVWEPVCTGGSPYRISGNEVTINYRNTVCDVAAYTYDRILGCTSQSPYIHTVEERVPQPLNIPSPFKVCPGSFFTWDSTNVPRQEGFLYKWKIQENMQHCASVQGETFSNEIDVVVNNFVSATYPVNFYMMLERRYCGQIIYDPVNIIVDVNTPDIVSIQTNRDTVCPGTRVSFSGVGGNPSHYRWKTNDSDNIYSGASFTKSFLSSGDHTVTLIYDNFDHCSNTNYLASTNTTIHVLPQPSSEGMYINDTNNIVGVVVPSQNNYSYKWYYNDTLLPNSNDESIPFLGYGCYQCIISNTLTRCSTTITSCFDSLSTFSPPCLSVNWDAIIFDSCTSSLYLKTPIGNSNINWSVSGEHYSLSHPNNNQHVSNITFQNASTYFISATSYDENCERSTLVFDIPFIHKFTFEKNCDEIIIHNNSSYQDGNIPIVIRINDPTNVSFYAHNKTFHLPVSPNGSYSFRLLKPYNCDLDTIVFNDFTDELILTASNGSENPVYTCNNIPLLLNAAWASGNPIDSVLWNFSDGTYYKSGGPSFSHTYKDINQYTATASIADSNGCLVSESLSIESQQNNLETGVLSSLPPEQLCPYVQLKQLTYTSLSIPISDLYNAKYQWNIGDYPNANSRPTYFTSNYTVAVSNQYFCKEHAELDVVFKTRPTAIILSEKYKWCLGDIIKLYGATGPDSNDYTYIWNIIDPNGNHLTFSTASVTFTAAISGIYEANLNITNKQGCDADASTVYITVYDPPSAPTLEFGSRLCMDDPPVELVGDSPTNELHWSNGNIGPYAYYFTPGIASAWYYDPSSGCKSEEAHIYIDAQPNFDAFLTGCYKRCPSFFESTRKLSIWGLTSWTQVIDWKWYLNESGIDDGFGNYSFYPLSLPLNGFGNYSLDVHYNDNNCHVSSPLLTITDKGSCSCDDINISISSNSFVKDCQLYYEIQVKVCNNSESISCFADLKPLFDQTYIDMLWTDFTNTSIAPNDYFTFNILLGATMFLPSHTAIFQLYDDCNKCISEISINLMPDEPECDYVTDLQWYDVIADMSNSTAVYFNIIFDITPCQSLISFWADPAMVIDYWYNGSPSVNGLATIDFATLSQLKKDEKNICIYALICNGDKLCIHKFCIPAKNIYYTVIEALGISPQNSSIVNEKTSSKEITNLHKNNTSNVSLSPNPTTGEVSIDIDTISAEDVSDKILEVFIMDMNGRPLSTFYNTSSFDISTLPSGLYIVRIKTLQLSSEKITYLKLIKN